MPSTSAKKFSDSSAFGVSSSTGPRCAMSGGSATEALLQAVDLPRPRAALEPLALDALLLLARERCGEDLLYPLGLDDRDTVGVEHHDVAGADHRSADGDRDVQLPEDRLLGALHA